ncbi:MAG: hypothetical protein E6614_02395 [Bradyrhizobium sp.]|nr:hypothetical protein [Bradyrhizobium sp.]
MAEIRRAQAGRTISIIDRVCYHRAYHDAMTDLGAAPVGKLRHA